MTGAGIKGGTQRSSPSTVISRVRYRQDAAVSAQLVVQWIDPKDKRRHKENFGHCKPIATQDEFTLVDAGIPDGAMVKFSSYVSAIGDYENDRWFKVKKSVSEGASFRQTGTAFKGWFEYVGLYDFHTDCKLLRLIRCAILLTESSHRRPCPRTFEG
ncbi:hypothetical protein B0H11DRAFT_2061574 [Mycena galericulata]|nr:hypothetical protein B0H11DRAFT_2061574 [Mycena galericulata]